MATAQLGTLIRHIKELATGQAAQLGTDWQLLEDFAARGDETAFARLVERYGPMVLRVCRRVLGHEQDAEDAFQATFLVLARHPRAIRKREALAGWLHGVAYRTAMKAKRSAARRRSHEAKLRHRPPRVVPSPTWDDVQAVLEEELQRLPESFRSAFVLCVLDGKTVPVAAAESGVKEGTLSWRLARARKRLQQQLTRRGIHLAPLLAALSVAESTGRATLPAPLARITIRSGLLVAAGKSAAGSIPAHVVALATGVTRTMFLSKAKIATIVLLAVGVFVGTALWAHQVLPTKNTNQSQAPVLQPGQQESVKGKPSLASSMGKPTETFTYRGRVVDPEGKPVAGAKLYLPPPGNTTKSPHARDDRERRPLRVHRCPRGILAPGRSGRCGRVFLPPGRGGGQRLRTGLDRDQNASCRGNHLALG
jgi:RNA polymerase sigma factor (sigma-70 family)